MSPQQQAVRGIWRWYWTLFIANALDLLLTYVAVQRGVSEVNRVLEPILFTPWPLILKFAVLVALAAGLLALRPSGRRPFRILQMVRVTAVFYLGVLLFHLVGLAWTG
jgi:hypothetical protein